MDRQLIEQTKQEYQKLLDENRLASALPLIRQAAHWSDVDSQILAERIYLHGRYGHPKSDREGFEYARLAAMNEDGQSMYDLALLYQNGAGIEHDLTRAKYWLEKAARYEFAPAIDALGLLYLQGRGTERNACYARDLFIRAKEKGFDPDTVQKHIAMAEKMMEKAGSQKD